MRVDAAVPPGGLCISGHRDTNSGKENTCWQEGTRCRHAVASTGMLAATTAVGLAYRASSGSCVGMRRAGLQPELVSSRTVRDTNRPTLPSSVASTVGRLKSAEVGLWTATAGAGQPAPSASRPSASRSRALGWSSDQFPDDPISELGVNEYPDTSIVGFAAMSKPTMSPA